MLTLRRADFRLSRRFEIDDYFTTLVGWTIVAVVAMGFGFLISEGIHSSTDTHAEQVQLLEVYLNDLPAETKSIVAQSLLDQQDAGYTNFLSGLVEGDDGEAILAEVATVANGDPSFDFEASRADRTWQKLFFKYGIVLVVYLVWSQIVFWGYVVNTSSRNEYLVDFPRKRFWPICLMIFTMLPIGWLFWGTSALRYRAALKTQERPVAGQLDQQPEPFGHGYLLMEEMDFYYGAQRQRQFVYDSQPDASVSAEEVYATLRVTNANDKHERLADLKAEYQAVIDGLRSAGERITHGRASKQHLSVQIRNLEADIASGDDGLTTEQAKVEYTKLCSFSGVKSVQADEHGMLYVHVEARMNFQRKTYDLGEFMLTFGPTRAQYGSRIVRESKLPGWSGYPAYRIGSSFCFGSADHQIRGLLAQGDLIHAIELAISMLNKVNAEDLHNVPRAFPVLKEAK